MKVVKPLKQGVLHRPFEAGGKFYLSVAIFSFFDFSGTPRVLLEPEMWKFAAGEMGKDLILDMGMPKPRGEFLVWGYCCAPGGKPVQGGHVRVRVGAADKKLYVFGDRYWQTAGGRMTGITDPTPFVRMPLTWDKAYGGADFPENPLGRGRVPVKSPDGAERVPLPNVEAPDRLMTSSSQEGAPAGFAPIDFAWPQRLSKAGTYDRKWLEERFPGLADDIDWTIFNAAPQDQWIEGYYRGDESFEIEYMHPDKTRQSSTLPGVRPRCFLNRKDGAGGLAFSELELRAETVWLFPHAEKGILIHRGVAEVATDDAMDVDHMIVGYEWMKDEPRTMEHYRLALANRLDRSKSMIYVLKQDDLVPPGEPVRIADEIKDETGLFESEKCMEKNMRKRMENEREKAKEVLKQFNLNPDDYLPPMPPPAANPEEFDLATIPDLIAKAQADMAEHQAKGMERAREACKQFGQDFDAILAEAKAKPQGGPPKLDVDNVLAQMKSLGQEADPEVEKKLRMAEAKMLDAYKKFAHRFPDAPKAGPEVNAALRAEIESGGRSFAGRDLTGVDLSGLDLSGADFSDALLDGANFAGTRLAGARFPRAVLARADFSGADITGADMAGCNIGGAKLHKTKAAGVALAGAVLSLADCSGADLTGADLSGADLLEAKLAGADLGGANLTEGRFTQVDITGAKMGGAGLAKSVFLMVKAAGADLSGCKGAGAVMVKSDFSGARFVGSDLTNLRAVAETTLEGADFTNAVLDGSNFRGVSMPGVSFAGAGLNNADLSETNLRRANFYRAVAKQAKFEKADLSGSTFVAVNLFKGSLRKAVLDAANFAGSNLYGVDFERAKADPNTDFRQANLKMTRMTAWRPK